MAEIAYLVAEAFNPYSDSGAPLRLSGTLRERPDPAGKAGAYYFATDQGIVFESTGKAWIVRGALGKDDVAGRASGLSTDMPPAGKMVGWIFHTTDTNRDYEAFPSGWYTAPPANPFTAPPGIAPDSLATLRSEISSKYMGRFQSTGDAETRIIMQTLDASLRNPFLVEFNQHILEAFTGDGQFDLVERDSIRRSSAGVSNGTAILSDPSGVMNWQAEDEGKVIKVGRGAGFRLFTIESVTDEETIEVDRIVLGSLSDLTLEMEGENEVTIATEDGFTDGDIVGTENTVGAWARFSKWITSDKVYLVKFAPGDTGDAIVSASARALNDKQPAGSADSPGDSGLRAFGETYESSYNALPPEDRLIAGLVAMSAFGLVGVAAFFGTAEAAAVGGTAIAEGSVPAGMEAMTVIVDGVEEVGYFTAQAYTTSERIALMEKTLEAVIASAEEHQIGGGAAGLIANAIAQATAVEQAESIIPLLMAFDATRPPIDINHGDHGVYLHYFVYPHGQSEGTPPGFPGFPGSGLPIGPGVFRICYTNDTPDGGPPICYFVQ